MPRRKLSVQIDEITRELDKDDMNRIETSRRLLRNTFDMWVARRQVYMPKAIEHITNTTSQDGDLLPEQRKLYLLSDFTPAERQQLSMCTLAQVELNLRKGEANDAIRQIRKQINYKLGLLEGKMKHVRHSSDNTRATKILRDVDKARNAAATTYRAARIVIISLGGDSVKEYPELRDQDMYIKSQLKGSVLGGGKIFEGWIVNDGPRVLTDKNDLEEWEVESECKHTLYTVIYN